MRYEAGVVVNTAPLVDQLSATELSVPVAVVVSVTSALLTRMLLLPTMPASSSSWFVIKPDGLSNETRRSTISGGNLCRQSRGPSSGGGGA